MTTIPLWEAAALLTMRRHRPSFRTLLRLLQRPEFPIKLRVWTAPGLIEYPGIARKDLRQLWTLLGPQPTQLSLPLQAGRRRRSR